MGTSIGIGSLKLKNKHPSNNRQTSRNIIGNSLTSTSLGQINNISSSTLINNPRMPNPNFMVQLRQKAEQRRKKALEKHAKTALAAATANCGRIAKCSSSEELLLSKYQHNSKNTMLVNNSREPNPISLIKKRRRTKKVPRKRPLSLSENNEPSGSGIGKMAKATKMSASASSLFVDPLTSVSKSNKGGQTRKNSENLDAQIVNQSLSPNFNPNLPPETKTMCDSIESLSKEPIMPADPNVLIRSVNLASAENSEAHISTGPVPTGNGRPVSIDDMNFESPSTCPITNNKGDLSKDADGEDNNRNGPGSDEEDIISEYETCNISEKGYIGESSSGDDLRPGDHKMFFGEKNNNGDKPPQIGFIGYKNTPIWPSLDMLQQSGYCRYRNNNNDMLYQSINPNKLRSISSRIRRQQMQCLDTSLNQNQHLRILTKVQNDIEKRQKIEKRAREAKKMGKTNNFLEELNHVLNVQYKNYANCLMDSNLISKKSSQPEKRSRIKTAKSEPKVVQTQSEQKITSKAIDKNKLLNNLLSQETTTLTQDQAFLRHWINNGNFVATQPQASQIPSSSKTNETLNLPQQQQQNLEKNTIKAALLAAQQQAQVQQQQQSTQVLNGNNGGWTEQAMLQAVQSSRSGRNSTARSSRNSTRERSSQSISQLPNQTHNLNILPQNNQNLTLSSQISQQIAQQAAQQQAQNNLQVQAVQAATQHNGHSGQASISTNNSNGISIGVGKNSVTIPAHLFEQLTNQQVSNSAIVAARANQQAQQALLIAHHASQAAAQQTQQQTHSTPQNHTTHNFIQNPSLNSAANNVSNIAQLWNDPAISTYYQNSLINNQNNGNTNTAASNSNTNGLTLEQQALILLQGNDFSNVQHGGLNLKSPNQQKEQIGTSLAFQNANANDPSIANIIHNNQLKNLQEKINAQLNGESSVNQQTLANQALHLLQLHKQQEEIEERAKKQAAITAAAAAAAAVAAATEEKQHQFLQVQQQQVAQQSSAVQGTVNAHNGQVMLNSHLEQLAQQLHNQNSVNSVGTNSNINPNSEITNNQRTSSTMSISNQQSTSRGTPVESSGIGASTNTKYMETSPQNFSTIKSNENTMNESFFMGNNLYQRDTSNTGFGSEFHKKIFFDKKT